MSLSIENARIKKCCRFNSNYASADDDDGNDETLRAMFVIAAIAVAGP